MTDYYVATTGNDSNDGAEGSPWLTLSKAATEALAGDTVYFRGGTYSAQKLTAVRSGTAGNPITFRNYAAETPIFDEGYSTRGVYSGVIRTNGFDYLTFDGLTIHNAQWKGILLENASNITVNNCTIDFCYSSGVMADGCDEITITNNDLQRCTHGIGGSAPHYTPNEWISYRNSTNGEIADNHLHNPNLIDGVKRGKEGIDVKDGSSDVDVHHNIIEDMDRAGLYIDAYANGATNVTFRNNFVARSQHGILVASEQGAQVLNFSAYNNVLWDNEYYGVWLALDPDISPQGNLHTINVYNNTIVGSAYHAVRITNDNLTDVVFRNNLCWGNTRLPSFNISSGITGYTLGTNHEDDDADPLFTDEANGDFSLMSTSPAIDAGTASGAPSTDYDDNVRTGSIDIGAFEYIEGDGSITGSASVILGALTATAIGALALAGATNVTLGALTLNATGAITAGPGGSLTVTLGALTVSATATLTLTAQGAMTLGELTLSAVGGETVTVAFVYGTVIGPASAGTIIGPGSTGTIQGD